MHSIYPTRQVREFSCKIRETVGSPKHQQANQLICSDGTSVTGSWLTDLWREPAPSVHMR